MSRSDYYREMCRLALEKRVAYGVTTDSLNLLVMQRIYRDEGIKLDRCDVKSRRIRAAYFCDDGDCSVLLNKNLPREPRLFAMAHELKHHLVDREQIASGRIQCGDYNAHEVTEIGAEVFAAEFIYPEDEMRALLTQLGITAATCSAKTIVEFRRTCPAVVSYAFVVKRFEWYGLCAAGDFKKVRFQKLEEQLFGKPFYKEDWFKRHRSRRMMAMRGKFS